MYILPLVTGAKTTVYDFNDHTPIILAATNGFTEIVHTLLDAGHEVNKGG